jgi:hypothetical protein
MGLEAGGVSVSSLGRRGGSWGRSWSGGALVLIPRRRRRFPSSRLPPRRFVSPPPPHRFVPPVVSCPPSFRRPRNPPCEQVARRRGEGAVPSLSSLSSVA